jgi:predicted nucleic acid-binding protein
MHIAIDSSGLVALLHPHDVWRGRAMEVWQALSEARMVPVTFDCVAAEAVSAAVRRLREKGRQNEVPGLLLRLTQRVPYNELT